MDGRICKTILLRDEARTTNKKKLRTDLNTNNVNLDQYTLMNATYAKASFTEKTICEVMNHLGVHFDIKLDWEKSSHLCGTSTIIIG